MGSSGVADSTSDEGTGRDRTRVGGVLCVATVVRVAGAVVLVVAVASVAVVGVAAVNDVVVELAPAAAGVAGVVLLDDEEAADEDATPGAAASTGLSAAVEVALTRTCGTEAVEEAEVAEAADAAVTADAAEAGVASTGEPLARASEGSAALAAAGDTPASCTAAPAVGATGVLTARDGCGGGVTELLAVAAAGDAASDPNAREAVAPLPSCPEADAAANVLCPLGGVLGTLVTSDNRALARA